MFGYAPKGININIPISSKSFDNQSVIIALTTSGILSYKITSDHVNTNIYFNFIKNLISKLTTKGYVFIFDNVSFHNVSFHNDDSILKLIKDNGHQYIYTPPYSPDLNSIENVNEIIKQKINKMVYNDVLNNNIKMKDKNEIKQKTNEKRIILESEFKNNKCNERNKIINEKIEKIQNANQNKKMELKNNKLTKEEKNEIKNKLKIKIKQIRDENKIKLNQNINTLKEIHKKNKKTEIANIKNNDITKIRKYIKLAI